MASIDFLKALHDMVKGGNGDVDSALRKLNKEKKTLSLSFSLLKQVCRINGGNISPTTHHSLLHTTLFVFEIKEGYHRLHSSTNSVASV